MGRLRKGKCVQNTCFQAGLPDRQAALKEQLQSEFLAAALAALPLCEACPERGCQTDWQHVDAACTICVCIDLWQDPGALAFLQVQRLQCGGQNRSCLHGMLPSDAAAAAGVLPRGVDGAHALRHCQQSHIHGGLDKRPGGSALQEQVPSR